MSFNVALGGISRGSFYGNKGGGQWRVKLLLPPLPMDYAVMPKFKKVIPLLKAIV